MRKEIETEIWVPHEEKKGMVRYVGQRKAKEVFLELGKALEEEGLCPSEGLHLGGVFTYDGVELFPKMYGLECFAQWGSNEGVYIDINILARTDDDNEYGRVNFAFGKDLGEGQATFDRMQYIAGYIYKLLTGDGSVHARYMIIPGEPEKSMNSLVARAESEMVDALKHKLFHEASFSIDCAEELALKLMILKTLSRCSLPEDKIVELFEQDNVLECLYPLCIKIMEANAFEIEDILMSCKSFQKAKREES